MDLNQGITIIVVIRDEEIFMKKHKLWPNKHTAEIFSDHQLNIAGNKKFFVEV